MSRPNEAQRSASLESQQLGLLRRTAGLLRRIARSLERTDRSRRFTVLPDHTPVARSDNDRFADDRYWDAAQAPVRWLGDLLVAQFNAEPGEYDRVADTDELLTLLREDALSDLPRVRAGGPAYLAATRDLEEALTNELGEHWRIAIDKFDWFNWISIQILDAVHARVAELGAGDELSEVMLRLANRGTRVCREISWLLRGGWPEAAFARWRTLHEIATTVTYMRIHGASAAERWKAHEFFKGLNPDQTSMPDRPDESHAPSLPLSIADLLGEPDAVVVERMKAHYGRWFATPYGWAADVVGKKPTFEDVERAAGMSSGRDSYRQATYPVHAISRPPTEEGFARHGQDVLAPTYNGLATPAIFTIRSLTQAVTATLAIFVTSPELLVGDMKTAVYLDALARETMDAWAAHEWPSWHASIGVTVERDAPRSSFETLLLSHDLAAVGSNRAALLVHDRRAEEAVGPAEAAMLVDPDNPVFIANLATVYANVGHFEKAIATANRALALAPDFPPALNALGISLGRSGRAYEAREVFGRSLSLMPDAAPTWHGLSAVLRELGDIDGALAALDKEIELGPAMHGHSLVDRGRLLYKLGRLEEAETAFSAACDIDSKAAGPWIERAHFYFESSRPAEGLASIQTAFDLEPDRSDARFMLAEGLLVVGRHQEALGMVDGLAGSNEARTDVSNLRGKVLAALGRTEEAERSFRAAAIESATNPWPNFNLAIIYEERDVEAAISFSREAADRGRANPVFLVQLAHLLIKAGRDEEARERLQRAFAIDPRDAGAVIHDAELAVRAGDLNRVVERLAFLAERNPEMISVARSDPAFSALGESQDHVDRLNRLIAREDSTVVW